MSEDFREAALAQLQAIEAEVFRFGQRVRALLQELPAGLPTPWAAVPVPAGQATDRGFLHLEFRKPGEVLAWAARLGTTVDRSAGASGSVYHSARGTVDGLPMHLSCLTRRQQTGGEDR